MAKQKSATPDVTSWDDDTEYTPEQPGSSLNDLAEYSFEELQDMLAIHIQDIDELTQADKEQLVGTPMFLLGWKFRDGDYGPNSEFAFVAIRTGNGLQWFTDGSTGIKDQLRRYESKMKKEGLWEDFVAGKKGAIYVPRGLRVSHYLWHDDTDNTDKPASTFYIDNADR